jgi:hypothetical protein
VSRGSCRVPALRGGFDPRDAPFTRRIRGAHGEFASDIDAKSHRGGVRRSFAGGLTPPGGGQPAPYGRRRASAPAPGVLTAPYGGQAAPHRGSRTVSRATPGSQPPSATRACNCTPSTQSRDRSTPLLTSALPCDSVAARRSPAHHERVRFTTSAVTGSPWFEPAACTLITHFGEISSPSGASLERSSHIQIRSRSAAPRTSGFRG